MFVIKIHFKNQHLLYVLISFCLLRGDRVKCLISLKGETVSSCQTLTRSVTGQLLCLSIFVSKMGDYLDLVLPNRQKRYEMMYIKHLAQCLTLNKLSILFEVLSMVSKYLNIKTSWDFPGGPVCKSLRSQCGGAWVGSLVGELDPTCMPQLRSPHATTRSLHATTKKPACRNVDSACCS